MVEQGGESSGGAASVIADGHVEVDENMSDNNKDKLSVHSQPDATQGEKLRDAGAISAAADGQGSLSCQEDFNDGDVGEEIPQINDSLSSSGKMPKSAQKPTL